MILPYCVFASNLSLPEIVTGVCECSVEVVTEGQIASLYSEIESLPADAGELAQEAMRFQSVVQQAFGAGVVLPFRFPHKLQSAEELRAYLAENASRFAGAIGRLDGMAQLDIRITSSSLRSASTGVGSGSPGSEITGAEYLKAKAADNAPLSEAERQIRVALQGHVRAVKTVESSGSVRMFALVAHAQAYEARQTLASLKPKGVRAVVSGPWPPSEFMDFEDSLPDGGLSGGK